MKNESFKVLSLKEEAKLTREELKEYYLNLREYVMKRALTNTTPGARKIAPLLKKPTEQIAKVVTRSLTCKEVEWTWDGYENVPDGPVIFAHNHQGILDNFVWLPTTDKHCLILHSRKTKLLLLLAQINTGLVFVKKGDKEHCHNAKLDMIRLLREGHSIAYFPESAWNLSPNKLHLKPLNFGFLDTAKKAGVPVVPVVHNYTYDTSGDDAKIVKVHTRYAQPIYVNYNDDLNEKLEEYQEKLSTTYWDLMEENGIFKRSCTSNEEYIKMVNTSLKYLELGGIDVNVERKHLFKSDDEFYKFFHINDVPFDENGNFLDTEEVQKLKRIDEEQEIKRIKKLILELRNK